jgi:hypothetical protein
MLESLWGASVGRLAWTLCRRHGGKGAGSPRCSHGGSFGPPCTRSHSARRFPVDFVALFLPGPRESTGVHEGHQLAPSVVRHVGLVTHAYLLMDLKRYSADERGSLALGRCGKEQHQAVAPAWECTGREKIDAGAVVGARIDLDRKRRNPSHHAGCRLTRLPDTIHVILQGEEGARGLARRPVDGDCAPVVDGHSYRVAWRIRGTVGPDHDCSRAGRRRLVTGRASTSSEHQAQREKDRSTSQHGTDLLKQACLLPDGGSTLSNSSML